MRPQELQWHPFPSDATLSIPKGNHIWHSSPLAWGRSAGDARESMAAPEGNGAVASTDDPPAAKEGELPSTNPLQPRGVVPSGVRAALSALDNSSNEREPDGNDERLEPEASSSSLDEYSSFSDDKAVSLEPVEASSSPSSPAEAPDPALERLSEASSSAQPSRGNVVGTVELSFSTSTRTPSVTLNPPQVSTSTLCFQLLVQC